ncbi:hypothetical protein BZG36_01106 [Bifiguratus adelaidae]|uniref:P-type H(+)-exporting transporter n=1 Tax=Bifiguratus adelaidae TaxID=1938954 RepID=A0A261Y5X0_9FUNG|nr:hypothetical protein BZG36_01106 [Bifiguratus adelaidae]
MPPSGYIRYKKLVKKARSELEEEKKERQRPHATCSACGGQGHNMRSNICPLKPVQLATKRAMSITESSAERGAKRQGRQNKLTASANEAFVARPCPACGSKTHRSTRSTDCPSHTASTKRILDAALGHDRETFSRKCMFQSVVRPEHRDGLLRGVQQLASFTRHVVVITSLFANVYFIDHDVLAPICFTQNFFCSVMQLVLGRQMTTTNAKMPPDLLQSWQAFQLYHSALQEPPKTEMTRASDVLAEAVVLLATTYTNHIVENFEDRVTMFVRRGLIAFDPRIAGGQATWPAEVPAHLGLVATVNRLCEELEALVPKPATKQSISASPGTYLPALKHILKSYEIEHSVAREAKRSESLALPHLFPLTPQPSLQWRHISLNAGTLASLTQQDRPSAPRDYSRVFESVFDLSRFRGKSKSTFANHAVTDGFSVSLTFARRTRRHDLEYVDLDLEDFGIEEVEAWFRPCAVDPGGTQAFAASYGAGQEQHEQRRVATREYYAQTGSAGRNRALQRKKERAGIAHIEQTMPTGKTADHDQYCARVEYVVENLDPFFNFYSFASASKHFYDYQGRQRAQEELANVLVNGGRTPEVSGAANGNEVGNEVGNEKPSHAVINVPNGMNLTVEELYDKEKFDLSTMELGDVYQILQTSGEGLITQEARARLEKFGPNKLEHREQNPILQFLGFLWNPLSWVMEAAVVVAIAFSNGPVSGVNQPSDWPDFIGIIFLLLANATIGFWEERQAGNAVQALMDSLAPEAKVKRNGEWKSVDSSELVPGDVVSMKLGDIVPADARLITANGQVSIVEAALTGESLPVIKKPGDEIFSGSTVKQGEAEAAVIGTGINTFFGRAAKLVGNSNDEMGHLQSILAKIGNFCMCTIGIFLVLEIIVLYGVYHYEYRRGINDFLVLLIGGIPIAMPTVLSVTLAVGAKQLAEQKAIVTRITAIEEMAAVTILCTDKTGTLTLNKLVVDKPSIKPYAEFNRDDIILLAAYASRTQNMDAIDACIINSLPDPKKAREGIEELHFEPFNPVIKRTEMTYKRLSDGKVLRVAKGMSHSILDICTRDKDEAQIKALNDDVDEYARRGFRALAVAVDEVPDGTVDGKGLGWRLVGLLPIYDPPRKDTKETIDRAQALGVQVKMITGDQLAIAKETGRRLGMGDNMFLSKCLKDGPPPESGYKDVDQMVLEADGFAGVYPEHKYEIIERLQKMDHMVAMTGDGVNDAPAISKADVGIAVADASDAARSAADIVLTEPGLSVIIAAIITSRQIFQRMRNYSIYTCSITIRVVVGFAILAFAYQFDFPPFLVLILAMLNDGTILTISTDRVKPSPYPNQWNLREIFSYAIVYGLYLALSTIVFFVVIYNTTYFQRTFGIPYFSLDGVSQVNNNSNDYRLHAVIYL